MISGTILGLFKKALYLNMLLLAMPWIKTKDKPSESSQQEEEKSFNIIPGMEGSDLNYNIIHIYSARGPSYGANTILTDYPATKELNDEIFPYFLDCLYLGKYVSRMYNGEYIHPDYMCFSIWRDDSAPQKCSYNYRPRKTGEKTRGSLYVFKDKERDRQYEPGLFVWETPTYGRYQKRRDGGLGAHFRYNPETEEIVILLKPGL